MSTGAGRGMRGAGLHGLVDDRRLEWRRAPNDRMRRYMERRRRHWYNTRVSFMHYLSSSETHPEDRPLVDESADATVAQLGAALTAMEVEGHFFGECSLTLALFGAEGRTVEQSAAEAMKVLAAHDGKFHDETYNLLNAWLSVVPGNSAHNLRRLPLLETQCADLCFQFGLDQGERTSAQLGGREALAIPDLSFTQGGLRCPSHTSDTC